MVPRFHSRYGASSEVLLREGIETLRSCAIGIATCDLGLGRTSIECFLDAMLTSGVAKVRANLMYAAVYWRRTEVVRNCNEKHDVGFESLLKMASTGRVFLDPSTYGEG